MAKKKSLTGEERIHQDESHLRWIISKVKNAQRLGMYGEIVITMEAGTLTRLKTIIGEVPPKSEYKGGN